MNRYVVQPLSSPESGFAVLDTDANKRMAVYQDRATADQQAFHYNQHKGTAVGAPITPVKKDWNPLDD